MDDSYSGWLESVDLSHPFFLWRDFNPACFFTIFAVRMQSLADSSAAGPLTEILSVGGEHGVNPWQFPLL